MHLGTAALLKFFDAHRDDQALVLVTITGTAGSTYRKPGAMMLVAADHSYEGMISGGCLEGDLLQHADAVFASGEAKAVTYDMHAADDLVFGLGIGCDGVIHLLLQRLDRNGGFQLLDWLKDSLARRQPVLAGLAIDSREQELPAGTLGLLNGGGERIGHEGLAGLCAAAAADGWPAWRHREWFHPGAAVMLVNIPPQPRVLLCGGGPDAIPVAREMMSLGWECLIADHRSAFARPGRFPAGCRVVLTRADKLGENVSLVELDAAIIMSHHLESDAAYLRQLAPLLDNRAGALRYLGVLGPTARRQRLAEMTGCDVRRIHGPVGLDIGAELPEAIALSIAAEIHAVLNGRDGAFLTRKSSIEHIVQALACVTSDA